jgi:hypothetical protein
MDGLVLRFTRQADKRLSSPLDLTPGGPARAEKIRRRRELRERFEVEELEDLPGAELELLDQALVRLNLLLGSDDDRVALRAVVEVFDRTLGLPKQQREFGRSLEQWPDMDAALVQAHQKLAARLRCRPARSVTPGLEGPARPILLERREGRSPAL